MFIMWCFMAVIFVLAYKDLKTDIQALKGKELNNSFERQRVIDVSAKKF